MTHTRDKILSMRTRQLEHLAKQLDARETKVRSIRTRKNWVERANNANYRNEVERIRGELAHFRGRDTDRARLMNREKYLEQLFCSGVI